METVRTEAEETVDAAGAEVAAAEEDAADVMAVADVAGTAEAAEGDTRTAGRGLRRVKETRLQRDGCGLFCFGRGEFLSE